MSYLMFLKLSSNPRFLVIVPEQSIVEPMLDALTVINKVNQSHTHPARQQTLLMTTDVVAVTSYVSLDLKGIFDSSAQMVSPHIRPSTRSNNGNTTASEMLSELNVDSR